MGRYILITTPENVHLEYPLAGLGSRFLALAVDTVIQGFVLSFVGLADLALVAAVPAEWAGWVAGAMTVLMFLAVQGYFIVFEALWTGQTPGKRIFGLRVLREGGYPLDFRASFIRNVIRLVDFLPLLYGVGVLFVFFHPGCRRLGDLAAGTYVVRERDTARAGSSAWQEPGPPEQHPLLLVDSLSREHLDLAEAFLRRRLDLDPRTRAEMAGEIAWRLRAALDPEPEGPAVDGPPERLIEEVVRNRARQAGI